MLNWLKNLLTRSDADAGDEVPAAEWQAAEARLPFLGHLGPEDKAKLRGIALDFIKRKSWQGAQGLTVTLPMQLEIALQACLLVLNRDPREYSDWVEIVVYPGDFMIPRQVMDEDGLVYEYDDAVMGEAWDGGPLLLSWYENAAERHGVNVVIHEFAHKLDMRSGGANGMPALPDAAARAAWHVAFDAAYDDFCQRVDAGENTAIDPYASDAPAEFFAVLSEVFFEQPALLLAEYPEVYTVLTDFYRQTPAAAK